MADVTTTYCTRWLLTLSDATVLGYTDHDQDITVGAQLYTAAIGYVPSAVQTSVELSPDNLDVAGIISDSGISESDLLAGRFDYCEVEVAVVDYANLAGGDVFPLVRGRLGRVSIASGEFQAELNSLAMQLQQNIGRIISPLCDADLGDTRCGYTLTTDSLTVTSFTDKRQFAASAITQADGYYDGGLITWLTGDNAIYTMDIKAYLFSGGSFELYEPMPFPIAALDTANVSVGCDKSVAQCKTYLRYDDNRGFPHAPGLQKLMKGP